MTQTPGFKLLLDNQYAPITSSIGFLEMGYKRAVDEFAAWQRELSKPGRPLVPPDLFEGTVTRTFGRVVEAPGFTIRSSDVAGPLAHALETLAPLTIAPRRRFLLVPTRSAWTAYFDNYLNGTDASGPIGHLTLKCKCSGLLIDATPDTMGTKSLYDKTRRGVYGASIFELYGPEKTEWLNVVRTVYAANDGGRWKFLASGTPQSYEEPETYKARRVRDKLPFELLDKYCRALGLRPFDDDFYLPPDQPNATLIERIPDRLPPDTREYTLAEVRAGVPWLPKGATEEGSDAPR